MREESKFPELNMRQARSFKATIVITRNDGIDPTLRDVESGLVSAGLAFAMPAQVDGTTVISFSILPPREGLSHGAEVNVVATPELDKEKGPTQEN